MKRLLLLLAVLTFGCVPEPSDPVGYGDLCLPARDGCPADTTLQRDAVGRNELDYTVENVGTDTALVRVLVRVPGDGADTGTDGEDTIIVDRTHRIEAGESAGNRWTPQDLGTRNLFELSLVCVACDVQLSYVLTSVPLECVKDDDCSGGWFCDTNVPGRCVECRDDGDCSVDQRCDTSQGRCTPPESSGCSTTDDPASALLFLAMIALGLGALRKRRSAVVIAAMIAIPATADAAPPVGSIALGGGPRTMTGQLGDDARLGIAIIVAQELRWTYLGGSVRLGTTFYLTDPDEPPYSKGLRTYSVALGPRAFLPIWEIELIAGVDYVRYGLSSNSLVRTTGTDTSFNAAAGILGARYLWSGLEVRLEGGYQPIFGLDSGVVSIDLAIALSSGR